MLQQLLGPQNCSPTLHLFLLTERRRQMEISGAGWGTLVVSESRRVCVAEQDSMTWLSSDCTHIEQVKYFCFTCQPNTSGFNYTKIGSLVTHLHYQSFTWGCVSRNILSNDNYLCFYAGSPKNPPELWKTLYLSLNCSHLSNAWWQLYHNTATWAWEERNFSQPVMRKQKNKLKKKFIQLLITETFSRVLPAQAVPLGHCHADTGVALQKTQKFSCSECAKNWFFLFFSRQTFRVRDPEVNIDVLQLEESLEEVQALLKHRKETLQFTESTWESPTLLIFKGQTYANLEFWAFFFLPAAFSRNPSQRTKPCSIWERRCCHSWQKLLYVRKILWDPTSAPLSQEGQSRAPIKHH